MFKQLFQLFRSEDPEESVAADFQRMLELGVELVREASAIYWGKPWPPEQRQELYSNDLEINRLQSSVRKRIVARIAVSTGSYPTRYLVLMSLVKDVERIGDYAKNLAEVKTFVPEPLPDDELVHELRAIRDNVEADLAQVIAILRSSDEKAARELSIRGGETKRRCDALLKRVARSDYSAAPAVALTLGTRYYKRIQGHVLNLLSSVIMPLHKLDYFDENPPRHED